MDILISFILASCQVPSSGETVSAMVSQKRLISIQMSYMGSFPASWLSFSSRMELSFERCSSVSQRYAENGWSNFVASPTPRRAPRGAAEMAQGLPLLSSEYIKIISG